jgi:hypothetical protein
MNLNVFITDHLDNISFKPFPLNVFHVNSVEQPKWLPSSPLLNYSVWIILYPLIILICPSSKMNFNHIVRFLFIKVSKFDSIMFKQVWSV